jgi:hypothetical protein
MKAASRYLSNAGHGLCAMAVGSVRIPDNFVVKQLDQRPLENNFNTFILT